MTLPTLVALFLHQWHCNRIVAIWFCFYFSDTATDYFRIEEVTEAAEGIYRCFANNSKGSNSDTTFLDVEGEKIIASQHSGIRERDQGCA